MIGEILSKLCLNWSHKTNSMKKSAYILSLALAFGLGIVFSKTLPAFHAEHFKKATGIGGIFFKCKNPAKMREWYAKNLGLQTNQYGTVFEWYQGADSTKKSYTQWSPFKETTKYFEPGKADYMINYRVEHLAELVQQLRRDSVVITDTIATYSYGKFVHIMDIENNTVELWEPIDKEYGKFPGGKTK
jgi:predicted enzyme related to lactoylglutathione lyase